VVEQAARPCGQLDHAHRRLDLDGARELFFGLDHVGNRRGHARQARAGDLAWWLGACGECGLAIDVAHHQQQRGNAAFDRDLRTEVAVIVKLQQRVARAVPGHAIGVRHDERLAVVVEDFERILAGAIAGGGRVAIE
jgi:hypothetical protein